MDRYTLDRCCDGCSLSRDPEGGWVEIHEVAILEARVEELEAENQALKLTVSKLSADSNPPYHYA